jgi:hypothetical protein
MLWGSPDIQVFSKECGLQCKRALSAGRQATPFAR